MWLESGHGGRLALWGLSLSALGFLPLALQGLVNVRFPSGRPSGRVGRAIEKGARARHRPGVPRRGAGRRPVRNASPAGGRRGRAEVGRRHGRGRPRQRAPHRHAAGDPAGGRRRHRHRGALLPRERRGAAAAAMAGGGGDGLAGALSARRDRVAPGRGGLPRPLPLRRHPPGAGPPLRPVGHRQPDPAVRGVHADVLRRCGGEPRPGGGRDASALPRRRGARRCRPRVLRAEGERVRGVVAARGRGRSRGTARGRSRPRIVAAVRPGSAGARRRSPAS